MLKFRLFWMFYKSTLFYNILISLMPCFLGGNVSFFFFSFCTIGFLTSIIFKEEYRQDEYYLYYNNQISKKNLILISFFTNIFISTTLFIILKYLGSLFNN